MTIYKAKFLMLTLFILWLGIFGVSPGYALTFIETQKLLASDGAVGDSFGSSVSISGNTAVIGAQEDGDNGNDSGSAYVFVRDGTGVWRQQQKLTASDGAEDDRFGSSVSIYGDTVLIGAWIDEDNGSYSGSAYVYVRDNAGVWHEQQKLTASDGESHDYFGRSVSIYGDTAVIGASGDEDNGRHSGSVYIFVRDASVWSEQQKLTASDGAEQDVFGRSVSLSGDTAVIGAPSRTYGTNSGSAYVFVRDGAGLWREQQKLTASDGAGGDRFGGSLSIFGDTAVVGARSDEDNGRHSGSVYIFVRDASVWSEQQKLTASDGAAEDLFGWSVSLSGDTAVIAANADDDNGDRSGSAYVFVRDGAGLWREQQKLTASDGAGGDSFGGSVSLSGDLAVIGASGDDYNGSFSGSAYIFEISDPTNDLLMIEKLINHRARETPATAAQLLAGTRYRAEYKVTNNSPNRLYPVHVFEGGQLVCNMYALDPGESKQRSRCATNQDVLVGNFFNLPATVTAKVSGSSQTLTGQTNAYYTGRSSVPGKLTVTHYVNERNADTQAKAVAVNGDEAEVLFRIENTGSIELYRVNTFHDPASPINSGWQQKCFIGTLDPAQVRYCKRTINITQEGLNKAFGRAQGSNANVSATGFVNASNPTYFNVVLP